MPIESSSTSRFWDEPIFDAHHTTVFGVAIEALITFFVGISAMKACGLRLERTKSGVAEVPATGPRRRPMKLILHMTVILGIWAANIVVLNISRTAAMLQSIQQLNR